MAGEWAALVVFAAAPVALFIAARAYLRRVRSAARPLALQLVLGNLLVLAFLLSAAALAGECWLRFVYDSTDSFGMLRTTDRWFARHYRVNNERFRDDVDYDFGPPPKGTRRITFVGDSFAAGHGIADVDDRFANRVRAARPAWQVHTLAVNGIDTGSELQLLDLELPAYTKGRYRYDLVVLVYCLNDVSDLMPEFADLGRRLAARRDRGVLARSSYLADLLGFLAAARSEPEVRDYYASVASAYDGPLWDTQRERLHALRDAVASRGGRLAVVTFPFLNDVGPGYRFRDVHRRLAEFWSREQVAHLDLLPVFEERGGDLVIGRFDAHPNERAHAIAAEAMLPFLDAVLADR